MKSKHILALKPFMAMVCISLALLAITHWLSTPSIQYNQITAAKTLIQAIIPPAQSHVFTSYHLSELEEKGYIQIPLGCKAGVLTLVRTQANGYSSKLTAMTSLISRSRTGLRGQTEVEHYIYGVRVVPPQQETPGLGDVIMPDKSEWITSFENFIIPEQLPLNQQQAQAFDQQVDHISGATISTGAVIKAVARALQFRIPRRDSRLKQCENNR